MSHRRGFTLVELLVVLAVLGLLMALVGPLTVERFERARAQEEWLTVQRVVSRLAFRAYADGRPIELRGTGTQLSWREGEAGGKSLDLSYLFFDPAQRVVISANGIAVPGELQINMAGRRRSIELNAWLEDEP